MSIRLRCPCGATIQVPDNLLGKSVRCPRCDRSQLAAAPPRGVRPLVLPAGAGTANDATVAPQQHPLTKPQPGHAKIMVVGGTAILVVIIAAVYLVWHSVSLTQAKQEAERLVEEAGNNVPAGNLADALALYTKASRLDPGNVAANDGIQRVTPLLDEQHKRKLVEEQRQEVSLAQQAESSGDLDTATAHYERAVGLLAGCEEAEAGVARIAAEKQRRKDEQDRKEARERQLAAAKQEELRRQEELRKRREAEYPQYVAKCQAFHDSLLRMQSALEVGISYAKYSERVQDMNFEFNKWAASLSAEESTYPSATLMTLTREQYVEAMMWWGKRIDSDYELLKERLEAYYQRNWSDASAILGMVKVCIDRADVPGNIPCAVCGGKGKRSCVMCAGSGRLLGDKCSLCNGTGEHKCSVCGGQGVFKTTAGMGT